ncbi:MAG: hypothetical protein AAF560_30680 [Acidobacteriota bacterium]
MTFAPSIAVYYEHREWFRPLFRALESRGASVLPIRADEQILDPAARLPHYSLFFNRMSPSAWERGRGGAVFHTLNVLSALEDAGVPVWNGSQAYRLDISKAQQAALLERLGLPVPRTRIVYSLDQLSAAAAQLTFPLIVKPNVGGNGAGIVRVDDAEALAAELAAGKITAGPDGVLLVQEYHAPRGGSIVRVETLEGRFLYAIRMHLGRDTFSICPADVCSLVSGEQLSGEARGDHVGNDARVESYRPPERVIAEVERIARAGHLDVGGVEYLESERDGRRYYYDVNALSNFIADAEKVVGFDPNARLADALVGQLLAKAA